MKAVVIPEAGGPDVLKYLDVEKPTPGVGEVLVKVEAILVGSADVLFRTGLYPGMPPFPVIPGSKLGGVIVELGEGVGYLNVGQRILSLQYGCYTEYAVVPSATAIKIQEGVDVAEALVAVFDYSIAHHILHELGRIAEGQRVLVHGAASGIGSCIVELAALANCEVVARVSSDAKATYARSLGAEQVVVTGNQNEVQRMAKAVGSGFDLIADGIAGEGFFKNFDWLTSFGKIVLYGAAGGLPSDVVGGIFANFFKSPALVMCSEMTFQDERHSLSTATHRKIFKLYREGKIHPHIHARLPLSNAVEAHEMLEDRTVLGRTILEP